MYYVTTFVAPKTHQMSLEELFFGTKHIVYNNNNETNTKTYEVADISDFFKSKINISFLIQRLKKFNESTEALRSVPRNSLYREFHIPKKSGGLRKIDAPNEDLMDALRKLKSIFENDFHALYHTSAFAYIKGRCTVDALKRHQANNSRWYAKYDLSNFFGSTTIDYVMQMFSMIFPFSEVMKSEEGVSELYKAIELAFLDGGLPQGTPLSPLITNIIMIPVDYTLSNKLRDYNYQRFVYTRYADDFQISSEYDFSFRRIERVIKDCLAEFGAPFTVNEKKTRYGSSSGSNWNLGLMINAENKITVGSKKKKTFEAMVFTYLTDRKNGVRWSKEDLQVLEGLRSYYTMVEGDSITGILKHVAKKFGDIDVIATIKADLLAI